MSTPAQKQKALEQLEANLPPLTQSDEIYWSAYGYLSSERPAAMAGISRIPWSKIIDYGTYYGFSEWMIDLLVEYVFALDAVNIDHHNKQASSRSK